MNSTPFFLNRPTYSLTPDLTTTIFEESDPIALHRSLANYEPTPLVALRELATQFKVGNIFVKDESFRFGLNAFKGLGASYAIHKILDKDPEIKTFCTATDGNHGRAVAWSAKIMGKEAYIFVPKDTVQARIKAIEKEGAVVEKINGNYEDTCGYAQRMAEKNSWTLVQDTAREGYEEIPALIMAGYLTHFRELENSLHALPEAKIDVVFLQAGVGSWPAAAAWYYLNRYGEKKPKLVIVEPTEAAGILASFKERKRTSPSGSNKTMMAGLNCGIPSLTAWNILKNTADAAMAVEDDFTEEAMRKLYFPQGDDQRIISGESGSGGLAGFIALMTDTRFRDLKIALNITTESNFLFYSTEGATDPDNFETIVREKISK